MTQLNACPLCKSLQTVRVAEDKSRVFHHCAVCHLIFVPKQYHISPQSEKSHYDCHQNSASDPHYRQFLSQLVDPLVKCLRPNSHGLDFGSGPGPALPSMFMESGHRVDMYDPFYAPIETVWTRTYDFITSTEVLEHLADPGKELDRLWRHLNPGGWLGIMTRIWTNSQPFAQWYYKNDATHICFYTSATFKWIARSLNMQVKFIDTNVIILCK